MHLALAAAAAADLAERARDRQDAAGATAAVDEMQAVTALFDAHLGDVGAYANDERQDRGGERCSRRSAPLHCGGRRGGRVARRARDDRESRFPWEEAYCGWRLAAALVRRGALRGQVREVLRDAYAIAERLGAVRWCRISTTWPRSTCAADAVPTLDTARQTGSPLSGREHQVLDLVIAGRTNAEIAATLFISEKTAGTHVSNILRKTGCRNRIEAAAWGQRLASLGSASAGNAEVPSRI